MRKLLVVPVTAMTLGLLVAFMAPAVASGTVRHLANGMNLNLRLSVPAVATFGLGASQSQAKPVGSKVILSSGASVPLGNAFGTGSQQTLDHGGHTVATAGKTNCGRFGDGFHGGKHDFVCPNRPFPVAHSGPVS